jgi:hypothetical protein
MGFVERTGRHRAIHQRYRDEVRRAVIGRFLGIRIPKMRTGPNRIERPLIHFDGNFLNVIDIAQRRQFFRRQDRGNTKAYSRP